MILSAAMMLDHLGENDKARTIRAAIAAVVAEGKVRTYDMMRISGGAKSLAHGRGVDDGDDRRHPCEAGRSCGSGFISFLKSLENFGRIELSRIELSTGRAEYG